MERGGNWTWANGKEWKYEDWNTNMDLVEVNNKCLQFLQERASTLYGAWTYGSCTDLPAFPVCEFEPDAQMSGGEINNVDFWKGGLALWILPHVFFFFILD